MRRAIEWLIKKRHPEQPPQNPLTAKVWELVKKGNIVHLTSDLQFTSQVAKQFVHQEPGFHYSRDDIFPLDQINDQLIKQYSQDGNYYVRQYITEHIKKSAPIMIGEKIYIGNILLDKSLANYFLLVFGTK